MATVDHHDIIIDTPKTDVLTPLSGKKALEMLRARLNEAENELKVKIARILNDVEADTGVIVCDLRVEVRRLTKNTLYVSAADITVDL